MQATAGTVTATTQFTVPYVDWGMKNPSRFLLKVSKQVEIEVIAKGTIKQAGVTTRRGEPSHPNKSRLLTLLHVERLDRVPGVDADDRRGQNAGDARKNP